MSALEVPAFLIGVAGLFSSCVDAFGYFKLAQRASRDAEIVLLKLDIEKARLMVWGENVGIFSAINVDRQLLDSRVVELVQRILCQIQSLLTDSDKLRTLYGVQTLDAPLNRAVDYVSAKSIGVFRRSADRFWTRNASKLAAKTQVSTTRKVKWAIYEREKFQALVNDLSHFVDNLFELLNVSREVQDRAIIEDIESILDISQLSIIEDATEDSYRAFSQAAASVRAATEAGTIDRRTVEEHLRDEEETIALNLHTTVQTSNTANLDLIWSEVEQSINYVVLTSNCRKLQTQQPCDVALLGSQVDGTSKYAAFQWDISSRNEEGGNTLWQLVDRLIDIKSKMMEEEDGIIGELLKERDGNLSNAQDAFIQKRLPLINLFIYCSPCVPLIHTSLSICRKVSSPFMKVWLRPDDRLTSSCCSTVDRTLGLRSALEWVREWESTAGTFSSSYLAKFLDTVWLGRRLDLLDYERPYDYTEARSSTTRVLIIGEADHLAELVQKAPGRIPTATDIWRINSFHTVSRTFFGRFIEFRSVSSPAAPQAQQAEIPRVRKPSSPLSSDSKRRKMDISSEAESGSEGSRDENTEDQNFAFKSSDLIQGAR